MPKIIPNNPNIVIAGSWNVAILSPSWLQKRFPKIFTSKTTPVNVRLSAPPEFEYDVKDMLIHPSSNRLTISAKIAEKATYEGMIDIASGIIEELCHTPIVSIGHNVAYKLIEDETFDVFEGQTLEDYQEYYSLFMHGGALNGQKVTHSIAFENMILNLSYDFGKTQKMIDFNFHYDLNIAIDKKSVISEFSKNVEYSREILNKVVKK